METATWPVIICIVAGACAPTTSGTQSTAPASPVHISGPGGAIVSTRIHNDAVAVTSTIAAPVEQVWGLLPRAYAALGIVGGGGDARGATFDSAEFHPRRLDGGQLLSAYIDCGRGITAVPRADEYAITMAVRTQLTPAADGGTVVATTVQAFGKPQAVGGNTVYCPSVGKLEARIIELVLQSLRGAP
jgi:hypothetical protein